MQDSDMHVIFHSSSNKKKKKLHEKIYIQEWEALLGKSLFKCIFERAGIGIDFHHKQADTSIKFFVVWQLSDMTYVTRQLSLNVPSE